MFGLAYRYCDQDKNKMCSCVTIDYRCIYIWDNSTGNGQTVRAMMLHDGKKNTQHEVVLHPAVPFLPSKWLSVQSTITSWRRYNACTWCSAMYVYYYDEIMSVSGQWHPRE